MAIFKLQFTSKYKEYDRGKFDCGNSELNTYLKHRVSQDVRNNLALCFVAVVENKIAGFYTLSQHAVSRDELPENIRRKIPESYIGPATLLGRLAVDKSYQRKGVGTKILQHAILMICQGNQKAATLGAIVIAKYNAEVFYLKNGFSLIDKEQRKYFLPIKVINSLVETAS